MMKYFTKSSKDSKVSSNEKKEIYNKAVKNKQEEK